MHNMFNNLHVPQFGQIDMHAYATSFAGIIHYNFRVRRNDMYYVVSDPRSCQDMTRKIHN